MTKTVMKYRRYSPEMPGDTSLELTAPWRGLAKGTIVTPLRAGHNMMTDRHERVVVVKTGPMAGRQVVGPF